jgi:hypothetical protein
MYMACIHCLNCSIVLLAVLSISTRGKTFRIKSEGGKLFAQNWWCLQGFA